MAAAVQAGPAAPATRRRDPRFQQRKQGMPAPTGARHDVDADPCTDPGTDPDLDLVLRAGRGERAACAVLVERYLDRVVALAGRTLMNHADAEEVAQETFLRVWQHASRWQPGRARFSTWLYRVTLNLCTDRLRQRRPGGDDGLAEIADTSAPAARRLQDDAVAAAVTQALAGLPQRQREAIMLSYYQELDDAEAARVLDISVDALESLLARGRRRLRELLRPRAADLMGDLP
jgi:RNA polymerase sigma-70 factor (ECF subfamily)